MKSMQLALLTILLCSYTVPSRVSRSEQFATTRAFISNGQPATIKVPVYNFFAMKLLPTAKSELQVNDHVRCMLQDKEGKTWFGTNNDGVSVYDGKSFRSFTTYHGLAGNAVRNMVEDKTGNIWLTTNNGLSRYDGKNFTNFTDKDGLAGNDAWSLLCDEKGQVWVGTTNGVSVYNNGSFTSFNLPQNNNTSHYRFTPQLVWSMYQDKAGAIYFGTDGNGLKKYDGKTVTSYNIENGLAGNNVLSVTEDKDGNIWLGTWGNGLSCYNGKAFRNYTKQDGLAANDVWRLLTDKEGNVWIATLGGGVSKYNGGIFTNYSEKQGLTYNEVQSIMQDKKGNIWFGFTGGVYRLISEHLYNFVKPGGEGC